VVFGLTQTAEAGYEIDPQVVERGVKWLEEHLAGMDKRTRAFALYSMALADAGDLDATRTLAKQADELDTFSRAALALTLHELGDQAGAAAMLDMLADTAVIKQGAVYWDDGEEDGHYYHKTMSSNTRSTALALSAFARIDPDYATARDVQMQSGIVRWLMGRRQQNGWGSTNETSFTILALTDHLLAAEQATADTDYRVSLGDKVVAQGTLGRGEPAVSLEFSAAQLQPGKNHLRVEKTGPGRLYYALNSRMLLPQTQIEADGDVQVERRYLDPDTGRVVTQIEAGQLLKVQLQVTMPARTSYVIIEDTVPGGLEALNEGLNTASHESSADSEPRYYWQEYGYNQKEVFADRVSFFVTDMEEGEHSYSYFARATRPGFFAAPPAEVSAMYDLATWGRSASAVLTVLRPKIDTEAGVPLPFTVCQSSLTWLRPSEEAQAEKIWSLSRYQDMSDAALRGLFLQDFYHYRGGASEMFDSWPLLGLWSTSDAYVCENRVRDIVLRREIEVWLLNYIAVGVRKQDDAYVVVVDPAVSGYQVLRFPGPDAGRTDLPAPPWPRLDLSAEIQFVDRSGRVLDVLR